MKRIKLTFLAMLLAGGLIAITGCATTSTNGSSSTPAITQDTFPLSDAGAQWDGWDSNPTTAYANSGSGDGPEATVPYEMITMSPKSWGWGIVAQLAQPVNLSQFSSGHLNFWVRTSYPGKILVGFGTGTADNNDNGNAYLQLASGDSTGFMNDGKWHKISLSISALKFWHKEGDKAPQKADLTNVTAPFFVADVFGGGAYRPSHDTPDMSKDQRIDFADILWSRS